MWMYACLYTFFTLVCGVIRITLMHTHAIPTIGACPPRIKLPLQMLGHLFAAFSLDSNSRHATENDVNVSPSDDRENTHTNTHTHTRTLEHEHHGNTNAVGNKSTTTRSLRHALRIKTLTQRSLCFLLVSAISFAT